MAEEAPSNDPFLNPSRRSYVYESSQNSGNRKRIILIIIGVTILIGLIAFAVIATGGKGEEEETITPTPTAQLPTEEPTPEESSETPTTTPNASPTKGPTPTGSDNEDELDRADLSVTIQNGGGVAGAATEASDRLKDLGYNVVSSGNADNFDYEETVIQVKSSKKEFLELLKDDLSEWYTIGSATADYTGSSDALVIVGKE